MHADVPEGGHCSSLSWPPWNGDLEPKGSSQTISRGEGRPWFSSGHTPEWFWHGNNITWDQPSFIQCCMSCCGSCCLRSCPQSSQSGASSSEQGQATTVLLCQQSTFGWDSATAAVPRQSRWEMPNLALLEERCSRSAHPGAYQEYHRMSWAEKDPPEPCTDTLTIPPSAWEHRPNIHGALVDLGLSEVAEKSWCDFIPSGFLCLNTGASQEQIPPASVPGCR